MLHMIYGVGEATGTQRLRQNDVHIILVGGASQNASAPRVLSRPHGGKRVRRMTRGNGYHRDCARVQGDGRQIPPCMWRGTRLLVKTGKFASRLAFDGFM